MEHNLVMLGPPGSGKGTQAKRIAEHLGLPHVSTGDILRDHVARGTELGKAAKRAMDAGQYVPDEVVTGLAQARLGMADAAKGFILDGYPRTLAQAQALEQWLKMHGRSITDAIDLLVPDAECVRRISGRRTCPTCKTTYHVEFAPPKRSGVCDKEGAALVQRSDDTEDAVRVRLREYHEKTGQPLQRFYRERGVLRSVDGLGPTEAVLARILAVLSP